MTLWSHGPRVALRSPALMPLVGNLGPKLIVAIGLREHLAGTTSNVWVSPLLRLWSAQFCHAEP